MGLSPDDRGGPALKDILVIPHGTGIGDLVNTRPLLESVVANRGPVTVLAPPELAWLLPRGARPLPSRWLRLWRRPDAGSLLARSGPHVSPRVIASAARVPSPAQLARGLALPFVMRGFEVMNLLEAFSRLDLDRRWTPGPWSADRRHVVDLLAGALEEQGIAVPLYGRTPRLEIAPRPVGSSPAVILSPNAGSTLKELPLPFWIDLARRLLRQEIVPRVLAAPGRATAGRIAAELGSVPVLRSHDLRTVTAFLAGADLVVSPDSGVLHLAAAVGSGYVGLFGSTDARFLGPYDGELGTVVESPFPHCDPCRGCWTAQLLPEARCALHLSPGCLADISAEHVARVVEHTLRAPGT